MLPLFIKGKKISRHIWPYVEKSFWPTRDRYINIDSNKYTTVCMNIYICGNL